MRREWKHRNDSREIASVYNDNVKFYIFDPELGSRSIISLSVDGDGDWDGDDGT